MDDTRYWRDPSIVVCAECQHVHGEYVGIMDAMAVHGSQSLPVSCRDAADRFIRKITRKV